ncbi:hypothetical protein GDO86_004082 [Hymenochirus boettgeri]|uniref:Sulfotransferase n=1 Tax=Hymenochirus boettgeri TaxID=247094 RepID=A0A8T2KBZ9_9PIPI|nr:hypothetical protein GDO86_004082 [Hymenochirus boettgeri]
MRRRLWLLLLLYPALLLLALLLYDGISSLWFGGKEKDDDWKPPPKLCPELEPSLWDNLAEDEAAHSPLPSRTNIYIHATWRSGSSFLGEIFNQHPRVFYLYEPGWHIWQSLYPGDAGSLQGAFRDLIASLFRCDFSALRLYVGGNLSTAGIFGWKSNKVICSAPLCSSSGVQSTVGGGRERVGLVNPMDCEQRCPGRPLRELEEQCRRYPVMVIKDVRLMELSALLPLIRDPGLNLRVVQLFRDPRAVHNSRLRTKQSLLRESLQVMRSGLRRADPARYEQSKTLHRISAEYLMNGALEVICQSWLEDLLLLRDPSMKWIRRRYLKIRYEDLVLKPRDELDRLLRFVGLSAIPELQDFLVQMTRGPSNSNNQLFQVSARDAREVVGAWKKRLSTVQVRKVQDACGDVMAALSYRDRRKGDR